jgi:hypothetical protein
MAAAPDILRLRLANHALARARFASPEEVVQWFGAVQAQDYLGSLWAIGLRQRRATEAAVAAAEADRRIVRTWPMRGTLHFVTAADVRWITRLLAPRVMARNASRVKKEFDVDARVLGRSAEVVTRALQGGRRLTRDDLYHALEQRRIRTSGSRGLHILVWLAMQGVVCHAGRLGKQQTFALLDEWIPTSRALEREAALAELALRYFTSHGPATLKDFCWWAGLTSRDAQAALDGASAQLSRLIDDGMPFWWRESRTVRSVPPPVVSLLPAFDEYTVGYAERDRLATRASKMSLLSPGVLIDGRVIGTWKRTLDRQGVAIAPVLGRPLSTKEAAALRAAAQAYGEFLGAEARLVDTVPRR